MAPGFRQEAHTTSVKLIRLSLVVALVLCIPFFIWGARFDRWFTGDAAVNWLRGLGEWGWLGAIGLLVSDIILPVPATALMSALGYVYGTVIGGIVAATGSVLAGLVAYGLCRCCGRGIAARIAGPDRLARYDGVFRQSGPWLVALSRWMPLLPEVVACLAGLSRMPFRSFAIALVCGSVPLGFVYAAIGAAGQQRPALAIALSILLPGTLMIAAKRWERE
jgi:uncharacterized membrane protein YdjX (TVP38/TMEM64 family)